MTAGGASGRSRRWNVDIGIEAIVRDRRRIAGTEVAAIGRDHPRIAVIATVGVRARRSGLRRRRRPAASGPSRPRIAGTGNAPPRSVRIAGSATAAETARIATGAAGGGETRTMTAGAAGADPASRRAAALTEA